MVFLRRPRTDCLLIKVRLDDLDRGFGVVGLRRTRCEDFERSARKQVRRPGGFEIASKKMPPGILGPPAAFFQNCWSSR